MTMWQRGYAILCRQVTKADSIDTCPQRDANYSEHCLPFCLAKSERPFIGRSSTLGALQSNL